MKKTKCPGLHQTNPKAILGLALPFRPNRCFKLVKLITANLLLPNEIIEELGISFKS
jgi:hypothetical protein